MILIYMNRFLTHWRLTGRGEAFCAHVITYADEYSPTKSARMRWGKIEGHDSVRRQNIAERAGVALWSRWSWRASYSKPSDDIRDVFLGDAPQRSH